MKPQYMIRKVGTEEYMGKDTMFRPLTDSKRPRMFMTKSAISSWIANTLPNLMRSSWRQHLKVPLEVVEAELSITVGSAVSTTDWTRDLLIKKQAKRDMYAAMRKQAQLNLYSKSPLWATPPYKLSP